MSCHKLLGVCEIDVHHNRGLQTTTGPLVIPESAYVFNNSMYSWISLLEVQFVLYMLRNRSSRRQRWAAEAIGSQQTPVNENNKDAEQTTLSRFIEVPERLSNIDPNRPS